MTTRFCIVLLLLQPATIKCFTEFNLIDCIRPNVSTSQSSTFHPKNNPQDFNSTKAIDGVQNYSIDTCQCCSVTNAASPSWWQIDLGQKYLLGGLQIFGRAADENSQLEQAEVYASNVSMKPTIASDRMKVYTVPSMDVGTRNFTEELDEIIAQYFLVELNQKVLTLCEFKLNEKECDIGYFGSGCMHSCHCSDNNRCDPVTGKCLTPGCLAGWKGEACAEDSNLIERIRGNVTTNQSSIYSQPENNPQDFNSSKAIDGVPNYSIDTCKCCSVTDGDPPSWWQIDLKQKYLLGGLHIFGRAAGYNGQLDNAIIYAGNVSMKPEIDSNKMKVYNVPSMDAKTRSFSIWFDAIIAQFFIVELNQKVLTLCEFKLYEKECNKGNFGSGCLHSCHCSDNNRCDQVTGKCQTPGCQAGWTGEACEDACDHRTFGLNCSSSCHCLNNTSCNSTTGECDIGLCDPGWQGSSCNQVCDHRSFGFNCSSTCHCLNNTTCNSTTGNCVLSLCDPGWQGPRCDQVCDHRSFGYNCSSTCHCLNNTNCNSTYGICITGLCDPGWQEPRCDRVCYHGNFGIGCNKTCHCNDNTSCDHISGHCNTGVCDPGWLLPTCSKACGHRRFGQNCTSVCHCFNNASCKAISGECHNGICAPGWQTSSCDKACDHRRFGQNCTSICHCFNNASCNTISGECHNGICDPGWQTPSCDKVCDNRTFGANCSSTCKCLNHTNCNSTTGVCDNGLCDSGWQGPACDLVCDRRRFGDACSSSCHCLNDTNCNSATGECDIGSCDPGWQGYSCDKVCSTRRFGFNCSFTCHCNDNATCNETTGVCAERGSCDPGWEGSSCSKASEEHADNSSGSTGAAVGGAVGATALVVLGVVIGLILFRRIRSSRKNNGQETKFSHLDEALFNRTKAQRRTNQGAHVNRLYEDEQETSMAGTSASDYYSFNEHLTGIKIHELWDYIRNKMENKCEQLISEFKTLQQGLVHPCRSADHISNRGKNRYKDMYAYDHTRVILDDDCEPGDDIHGGYINACYIDGFEKVKKFVASQGPTKNMVDDFWRMVWQLKSDKIVMLTNVIEMGTTKCLQYWPKEEDGETECSFGDIVIRLLEIEKFLDYNIHVFEVTKNGEESRRIRQFHFKSWPDKDVPDSTWCLVNFWRVVDTNIASNAGPIVVHCSAGVGRTGTFIGLDNLVNQARMEGCIRPLQVVQNLRSQRVNMVQTKEQYVYLHEAAADAMYFGTHIIWTKQFRDVLEFMIQKDKVDARTRLQIQFELIEKSVVNSSSEVAESPEYSNVDTLLSESAAYRPKFMNKGSTFVQRLGAMCITNYKGKSTFLVSMSPDKDTMEEFWSLVDDNNIKTVIMLTEQSSPCYQSSCELGSCSGNRFSVNKIEEKRRKGYTQRTFTFKESVREEEDHLTTVKQFEYTAWKDGYLSPGDTTSFLDMIEAVLKWQPHLSESQPVLVHCGDGCTRSGIVCVLLNELQRMKYEGGHVNIVESVKMMKKRQRHLISSYEQYKFCFDLIMDHIKRTEDYQNL